METSGLADARMQNMALVGTVAKHGLIPGVSKGDYAKALEDLLTGDALALNLDLFNRYAR